MIQWMTFLFVPFAALKQITLRVGPALRVFVDGLSCTVPSRRRKDRFFCCPLVGRIFLKVSLPSYYYLKSSKFVATVCLQWLHVVD